MTGFHLMPYFAFRRKNRFIHRCTAILIEGDFVRVSGLGDDGGGRVFVGDPPQIATPLVISVLPVGMGGRGRIYLTFG